MSDIELIEVPLPKAILERLAGLVAQRERVMEQINSTCQVVIDAKEIRGTARHLDMVKGVIMVEPATITELPRQQRRRAERVAAKAAEQETG